MSPLPTPKTSWPPAGHHERLQRMRRAGAWYSGADKLREVYGTKGATIVGGPGTSINPAGGQRRVVDTSGGNSFWAHDPANEVDTRRHLPTAQDISTLSSELLASDQLSIVVKGPVHLVDGPEVDGVKQFVKGEPTPDTARAQAALDKALDACNFHSLLLAAFEVGSALGSVGLRIALDKTNPALASYPVITRVNANAVIPLYSWGQLTGVMFWRVVLQDKGDTIWRHIELHENGRVLHGLYKGTSDNIGERRPLVDNPNTEHLAKLVDAEGGLTLLASGGRTGTSIPNALPDPADLDSNAGRSDYTDAVIDLFESIDQVYTQMMEAIDDARSRLFIADSMLERKGAGKGKTFDTRQRVFERVKMPPSEKEGGGLPIEKVQFDMKVAEWLMALDALTARAVRAAGFNPQSMGDEAGGEMTATEYQGRNKRSMSTRKKKIRYAQGELSALLTSFLAIYVQEYAPRGEDGVLVQAYPVEVTFPDAATPGTMELANTVKTLKEAEAASKYERVRIMHPEYSPAEIQAEVDRILQEGSVVDPVTFGMGGRGVGPGDGI